MKEIEFIRETLDDLAVYVRRKHAMRSAVTVSHKGELYDIVTEVDSVVQSEIARRIANVFPKDAVIAEEDGLDQIPKDAEARVWIIDPIDGTQNFIRGLFPTYGISVGLAAGGIPVAGGVAVPGTGELFLAQTGSGALRNGERIRVSAIDNITQARAEVDFSSPADRTATLWQFGPLIETVGQVRCHCAAVIGLCSIATGDMDAYVHVGLNPWDYAASMIIVQEAGGLVTRLDGTPISLFDGKRGVLGSNGLLHAQLGNVIRRGTE